VAYTILDKPDLSANIRSLYTRLAGCPLLVSIVNTSSLLSKISGRIVE